MSALKKIPLADATDDQLRDFAELTLQLDVTGTSDRSNLLSLIQTAWPQDFLMAEEAAEASDEQTQKIAPHADRIAGGIGDNDPKVILVVREDDKPGGKEPVALGVNGRTIVLQRNVRVEVPYRFYLNLRDAAYGSVVQDPVTKEAVETQSPRYNIVVESLPTPAEIAEWHARVDDLVMPA